MDAKEIYYALQYDDGSMTLSVKSGDSGWFRESELLESIRGYADLAVTVVLDCIAPVSCKKMFMDFSRLRKVISGANWNTSRVQDFSFMFANCIKLESVDTNNWDVRSAINFRRMFFSCGQLQRLVLDNWKIKQDADITDMFASCILLISLGNPKWKNNRVEMKSEAGFFVFQDCKSLGRDPSEYFILGGTENAPQSSSSLYDIAGMMLSSEDTGELHYSILYDPSARTATVVNDPNGWMLEFDVVPQMMDLATSVRKVVMDCAAPTSCASMFKNFADLEEVVFTGKWTTKDTTGMAYMFSGCTKLKRIDCSNWDVRYVRSFRRMFFGCSSLEVLNLERWQLKPDADVLDCFSSCTALRTIGNVKWTLNKIQSNTDAYDVFVDCTSLERQAPQYFNF